MLLLVVVAVVVLSLRTWWLCSFSRVCDCLALPLGPVVNELERVVHQVGLLLKILSVVESGQLAAPLFEKFPNNHDGVGSYLMCVVATTLAVSASCCVVLPVCRVAAHGLKKAATVSAVGAAFFWRARWCCEDAAVWVVVGWLLLMQCCCLSCRLCFHYCLVVVPTFVRLSLQGT